MPGPAHDERFTGDRPRAASPQGPGTRFLDLPRPRHWAVWVVLLSAVVLALGLIAQLVPGFSATEMRVDEEFSRHHAAFPTAVAMALNIVFAPLAGGSLVLLTGLYLWLVRRSPVKAAAFSLVASSGWVASGLFKIIIARQRPDPALLFDPLSPETGSNSFPSGHTCFAVALAFALYFLARGTRCAKATAAAGAVTAIVVGWSRVYIGVHYPTDVAASFLAASAAVLLLVGLWNLYSPRFSGPSGVYRRSLTNST
jgi:membrane-associated phospholipid phosphatase